VEGLSTPLNIRIISSNGKKLTACEIKSFDTKWQYYSLHLIASGNDPKANLEISGEGSGTLYLDMVSMISDQTGKITVCALIWQKHWMCFIQNFCAFPVAAG
jgi:hypothetical protein